MESIFWLAREYPFWGLPLALVLGDIGLHFRRKKSMIQNYFWFAAVALVVFFFVWLVFRGDLNSDTWVKSFKQQ